MSVTLQVQHRSGRARAGVLHTPRGSVETPAFMPVGTQASVKMLDRGDLEQAGARIVLANTYHLSLRPGVDVVAAAGGLHRFMNWPHPILTDSGGFQVFSLARLRRVDDDGVEFRSHIDGSLHRFTPEGVVRAEHALGADIIMALDECPPYPHPREGVEAAVERTARWAARCLAEHARLSAAAPQGAPPPALFGIVQGGAHADLRRRAAEQLVSLDFPGYAIGGLSVGEPAAVMYEMLDVTVSALPEQRPRYLMGVGSPEGLVEGVCRGVDLFDCVLPTREARHGAAYTSEGRLNLRNARYQRDFGPLDPRCRCRACQQHSRAYLRHLLIAGEGLAARLLSIHNLAYLADLMRRLREAIRDDRIDRFRSDFLAAKRRYETEDG